MHRGFGKGFPGGPGFGFDGRGFYGRDFDGRFMDGVFGFHWIGALVMLGLIVLLLIAAYFIYRRYRLNNNLALQILNKRFVTGEIDEEEYLRKKELLLGKKVKKNKNDKVEVEKIKKDADENLDVKSQTLSIKENESIDNKDVK